MKRIAGIFAIVLPLLSVPAFGSPIVNGFDLATFNFDITSYTIGPSGQFVDSTASGTSNGIGWTISPTSLWSVRTITDGTFNSPALGMLTDNLHPSLSFTITFDQPIATLIVALSNDNLTDSINFGLTPSFAQGVTFIGTQAVLDSPSGGLVWFTNVNSLTISHVDNNEIPDGFDLAFHAIAADGPSSTEVPEPQTYATLFIGLGLLCIAAHRLRRKEGLAFLSSSDRY